MTTFREKCGRWKNLISALTSREIKKRYHKAYLSIAWSIINPLATLAVFAIIFYRVAKLNSEGISYPLFSLTGLIPWIFLANSIQYSSRSLIMSQTMITRLKFPYISLPISSVYANLPGFLIPFALLSSWFIFAQNHHSWTLLYVIPIFLIQFILALGISFFVSIGTAYFRDLQNVLPIFVQCWLLLSPVGYSLGQTGKGLRFLYLFNPMAGIIDAYRKILIHQTPPNFEYFFIASITSCFIFVLGYLFFKKLEWNLADAI